MGRTSLALVDRAYRKQSTSAVCYHSSQQGQAGNAGPQWRTAESLWPDTTSPRSPHWARLFICFASTSPAHIFQPLLQKNERQKKKKKKMRRNIAKQATEKQAWKATEINSEEVISYLTPYIAPEWGAGWKASFLFASWSNPNSYSFNAQKHSWALPAAQAGLVELINGAIKAFVTAQSSLDSQLTSREVL